MNLTYSKDGQSATSRLPLLFSRVLAGLLLICATGDSQSRANDRPINFGRDVYRVLQQACIECHGPARQEGELRLDTLHHLESSGTVVPSKPDDSELLRRISLPKGHDEIMPAIGEPLTKSQVDGIRRWIVEGAIWPKDFEAGMHWAYMQPKRPVAPQLNDSNWPRNDIDRFVLARLKEAGLNPAREAAPETLVRRLYLDLIGLPPTPDVVSAFVADPSDAAYEKLVSDLLARPQFGERWARPWLDLARYADSHGFQRDNLRDIWAYRDWVIKALNADMPFDRFTIEQIAGDLLPNATEDQKIATGFHRCTPTNVEAGSLPEETRVEQVIDRVNTTGAVWLGSTLECAQCHDHKYDPFSQKDYYRLLAFYNSTEAEADRADPKKPSSIEFRGPDMALSDPVREAEIAKLNQQKQNLEDKLQTRRKQMAESLADWSTEFAASLKDAPQTHLMEVVDFQSQGTTDRYDILPDGSVLIVGDDPPPTDEYVVTILTDVSEISAIQLEALTHKSLPGTGPGRGDSQRTNFVLNRFKASVVAGEDQAEQPLEFSTATADFSQKGWDVTGALSDKPKTGWAIAPQFKKLHRAQFILAQPLSLPSPTTLRITLTHDFGSARSIGRLRLSAMTGNVNMKSVSAELATAATKPSTEWTKVDRKTLFDYRVKFDTESQELNSQIAAVDKQLEEHKPDTTLVMIELDKPRSSYVFDRGDYRNKGESIERGTPGFLHTLNANRPNRLDLARWLVDPANPLVARVTVNRWWSELFGRGIVATPEDFGIKGEYPTHPDLLDWLAVELVENGWSMKHLLHTIVTSATYRQSSKVTSELLAVDDQNKLLARGARFRMDAEMIRDYMLSAGGLLDLQQFGPPIRPFQPNGIWSKVGGTAYDYKVSPGTERYRRGIYVVLKRGAPYPSFINFDATARLACTVQRSRTNTPLQALTLLNDPVYVEAATALAKRTLLERSAASTAEQLTYAFRLCTARRPTESELSVLTDLLETQKSIKREALSADKPPSAADETQPPAGVTAADFKAWTDVTTTLLNLHETITRN
ncbi:DUF1553 domain-containing protein [Fuerstiella marisgermanici]|uniref:Planctomycete cytochrome C n=1 Tax=Fuerstiella marisgermanici TaxID=1891926 RepID=A0A1P8WFG0_9PLAN|nr:PSD1 and planctomycete cytochrome C domain-containing protein [Fuerstiella marisgermanici]APZ92812.1 Planctomycete cytochrome C [Fuerstiella marisgermanici]